MKMIDLEYIRSLSDEEIQYVRLYLYDVDDVDTIRYMVKQYRRQKRLDQILGK